MLTGALIRVRHFQDRIVPRYVDPAQSELLAEAQVLLDLFERRVGDTRGNLELDLLETFGDEPGQFVRRGLSKLLDDRCTWSVVANHPPEDLRAAVFAAAFRARSAGAMDRSIVMNEVADRLQITAQELEDGLFADLKSEQRLIALEQLTAERLLHRYNVALVQGIVLKAVHMSVELRNASPATLRRILRSVKFHRLICKAFTKESSVLRLELDGPLSLFSATHRYGLQLANFLPHILLCGDFTIAADVRWGPNKQPKQFVVTSRDGLNSHVAPRGDYVPPEAAMFAEQFRKRTREWELIDETDVIRLGDSFWVPDYRLIHRGSRQVVQLEILGFWRKGGAEKHLERLRDHAQIPYLVAVSDQLKLSEVEIPQIPGLVRFRQMPLPEAVMAAAAQVLGISQDRS